jgi:hypothetical protein
VERIVERVWGVDLANSLPSSTLASLDHDRVANLFSLNHTILNVRDAGLVICLLRNDDKAARRELSIGDARTGPCHSWHLRMLSDDSTGDLVSETTHCAARWTDEDNLVLACRETLWQTRIFRRMPPARPDSVYPLSLGDVYDEVDVRVVVIVRAPRDLNIAVRHANVLRIDLQILRGGHDGKLNGTLGAKCFVAP